MTTDRDLIQEVILGWYRIKSGRSKKSIRLHKLGNHLAQQPLCDRYLAAGCIGCPVERATSRALCHHTPFDKLRSNIVDWAKGKAHKSRHMIDRQIEFMKDLDELEKLRGVTKARMMSSPVLAEELRKLLNMNQQKLSWWMKNLGYHVVIVRRNKGQKVVYYDRPSEGPARSHPAYECASCGRIARVVKEPLMPFSLTCAECKGILSLTGIDGETDITHRIAGNTIVPLAGSLSCIRPSTNTP